MKITLRQFIGSSLLGLLLQSCQTPVEEVPASEQRASGPQVRILGEAEVLAGAREFEDPQRALADILFAGLQALSDDRLLTPVDDNAHARFMRVLAYDADNEIALQGLQDIVLRYLELAQQASRRGVFEQAQAMIDRAKFVDASHPDIEQAVLDLAVEMQTGDLIFELDQKEFASRSELAQENLADIARQAKENSAFFLITAPNDEQARWMFLVMRDAVGGYRLRGNIELSARTSVRLRLPEE